MSLDLSTLKVGDRVEVPGLHNTDPMDVVFVGEHLAVGRRYDGTECLLDLGARSLVPPPPLIDPDQVWYLDPACAAPIRCHGHGENRYTPLHRSWPHFRITATEPAA